MTNGNSRSSGPPLRGQGVLEHCARGTGQGAVLDTVIAADLRELGYGG